MSEGFSLRRLAAGVRALPPLAVDVGLAVAVYALTVFPEIRWSPTDWRVVAFGTLTAVPLVWRRRWPVPVTAVTGVGTVGLAWLHAVPQLPYGQLLATYTFAALSGPLMRWLGLAGTVTGIAISMTFDKDPFVASGVTGMTFATAYALGVGVRARQSRIAMLEERGARLAEEQARAAATERERIARDMHDILVHSVSLIVVQAEAGAAVIGSSPAKAEAAFEAISETGREALAQLRSTLGVLRGEGASRQPQPDLGRIPALVEGARHADLEAELEQAGEPRPVPAELGIAAYRIVQEALTNTIKHAGARRVRVRLTWRPRALGIEVTDDGRGPNGPGEPTGGHGLVGMRERVAACGGELSTGPGPAGSGFRVAVTLPTAG